MDWILHRYQATEFNDNELDSFLDLPRLTSRQSIRPWRRLRGC